jgi:PPM family protein phosphatase
MMRFFKRKKRPVGEMVFGMTDVGRMRNGNEDTFLLLLDKQLYIVSDGMGGHNAGEVASLTAVRALETYFAAHSISTTNPEEIKEALINAVIEADEEVRALSRSKNEYYGMGCTVAMVMIDGDIMHTCHIGDSRVYVIGKKGIVQVTTDHSVVTELVQAGTMSREEARQSHLKNQLTQAIGVSVPVLPEYSQRPVEKGDIALLCTDGLWDMLTDDEIYKAVNEGGAPQEMCARLIRMANDAGGSDNITVIVASISGKDGQSEAMK